MSKQKNEQALFLFTAKSTFIYTKKCVFGENYSKCFLGQVSFFARDSHISDAGIFVNILQCFQYHVM